MRKGARVFAVLMAVMCLPGCGLLGITAEDAVVQTEKLMGAVEGLQQALDNAAKMDQVRKDVAVVTAKVLDESATVNSVIGDIAALFSSPNPTPEAVIAASKRLQEGNDASNRISELVQSIDAIFGKTALPPDLQMELTRLRDSSVRLMERIRTTAARVKIATDIIVKAGGVIGNVVPAGGGIAGIITAIVGGATVIGAAAQSVAKRKEGSA